MLLGFELLLLVVFAIAITTVIGIYFDKKRKRNATCTIVRTGEPFSNDTVDLFVERSYHTMTRFPMYLSVNGEEYIVLNPGGSGTVKVPRGTNKVTLRCASVECEKNIDMGSNTRLYLWFDRIDTEFLKAEVITDNLDEILDKEIKRVDRFHWIIVFGAVTGVLIVSAMMILALY